MRKILFSILLFAAAFSLDAQDVKALIEANPDRAANNMHSYEFCEIHDTPAPKGFKPFYISHYGRHGSRFELNSTFAKASLEGFEKLASMNLLNEDGKKLYADVKKVQDEHVGMEGSLTPRGASEHRQIAKRMAERYPEVFSNKDRNEVSCYSSTVQRCIVSMTNFSYSLKEEFPKLDFTFASAERYMSYINPSLRVFAPGHEPKQGPGPMPMARPAAPTAPGYDFTRFLSQIVTDTNAAMAALGNPEPFVKGIFSAGSYCQLIDYLGIEILRKYFLTDELVYFWASGNDGIYRMWAGSEENGDNVRYAIRPLLQNFIETADAALKDGSHRAADLRFGHDTSVLPLFALLGVDDLQGRRFPYKEAHSNGWYAFFQIPMGTNCQMIYYKNKKGEVLTKILYNEAEVTLPGLESDIAPYYRWDDLKAYFEDLVAWKGMGPEKKTPDNKVVIVYENDPHSTLSGYPKMVTLKNQVKAETPYVLTVSNGDVSADFMPGTKLGNRSHGAGIMEIMNKVGYDYMVPGNHDFDFSVENMQKNFSNLKATAICCNFKNLKTGEFPLQGYAIREIGGVKIAFVGVLTPKTISRQLMKYFADAEGNMLYSFCEENLCELVQQNVDKARAEGADYVIVLSHLGDKPNGSVTSLDLIAKTKGIDVVLDAHAHTTIPDTRLQNAEGKEVILTSTGLKFANIGLLTIGTDGTITPKLVPTQDIESDAEVEKYIEEVENEYPIEEAAPKAA